MIFKLLPFITLFTLLLASTSDVNKCIPTHLQLSLGDTYYSMVRLNDLRLPSEHINDNQAYLVFQTQEPCQFLIQIQKAGDDQVLIEKSVDYVHDPNAAEDAVEEVEKSPNSDPIIYNVLLENLSYETQYQYTIFDHEANPVALTDPHTLDESRKILIAGSLSNQEQAITTINQLSSLASSNYQDYAAFLQLGNIHLENVDQQFLETIRSFTSVLPTSVTKQFESNELTSRKVSVDGTGDFKHQPIRNPLYNMTHNHYFSFNLQGIHFVSINFDYYEASPSEVRDQIDRWLENDLEQANDAAHRKLWPWIVALTNKPTYCGSEICEITQDQQKHWDEFFSSYKVDLALSGNIGEYQRLGSDEGNNNDNISRPTAPVYIIEGAGYNNSQPVSKPGYGMITIQNNTNETRLVYEHYDSETQTKIDSLTIQRTYKKTDEEVVVPQEDNKEEEKEVLAPISNNGINIKLISMIALGIGVVVAAVVGVIIWRKKKGAENDDPEVEGLKKSELRSNKIYTNKKSDKSIPMVDLVL